MAAHIEFFFDLSSPWTRIAFRNIQKIAAETGSQITWRPFLVGGVFNAVNQDVYVARANENHPKNKLTFVWLKEWADLAGLRMNFPSPHHPVKSVHAMRYCCALEEHQDSLLCFSEAAFEAYFGDQRNLDDPGVLKTIADEAGFDGEALAAQSVLEKTKDKLRANTQEAIDRGAFGSPSIFVDRQFLYFGNDQLPLVRRRLEGSR